MQVSPVSACPPEDIERLVRIDQQIDANESTALRARWEFGQQMLAARDGAGRLPNGYLAQLVERTGKSRAELGFRVQFAATYPTETQLSNALDSCASWSETIRSLKASKDAADNIPVEPQPVPAGQFSTFVADPPWQYGNTSTPGAPVRTVLASRTTRSVFHIVGYCSHMVIRCPQKFERRDAVAYVTSGSIRAQSLDRQESASARRVEAAAPSKGLAYVASLYGVEASEAAPEVARDMVGLPIRPLAQPVRLTTGRPPEEWTQQERRDAALWALGPLFRRGLKPPPGSAGVYVPSPRDVSSYNPHTGEWEAKRPW